MAGVSVNGAAGGTKSTTVTPEKRGGTTRVGNITAMVMIGKEMDGSNGISGEMRNPEGNPHSPAKGHPPPPAHQKKGEGFSSSGNNKAHQLTQRN